MFRQAVREGWPRLAATLRLPPRVHEEVRRYLQCGDLRRGFSVVRCDDCRRSELIAFSCKTRGWCPSCGARRAHETALHDVRKAAKRARYAAETLGPLFGSDAAAMESAAEAVQQSLGDHRDTLLTRQALRVMGVQAHLDGDNGFTFGRLHALEEVAGSHYLGAYEKAHAKADKPRLRRWLG